MRQPDFSGGLVPAVVQDSATGSVLMLAYMNRAAWESTQETGFVHFWSRSRDELWKKGETSGNTLHVESWSIDCDSDTILVQATPAGPACHTGATTCFGEPAAGALSVLADLDRLIADRAQHMPEGSYTTSLISGGPDAAGRKVVEEATEVILAAKDHAAGNADDRRLAEEAADLLYHLIVALRERGLSLADAAAVLAERAEA